jgi:gamma-glutamylcyclotransferase (GGCT)/AIG2-like uncharacterized protein YtfP
MGRSAGGCGCIKCSQKLTSCASRALRPIYDNHSGSWPAAISGGVNAICGELYQVSRNKSPQIDAYECHPEFFQRTPILLAGPQVAFMWIYVSKVELVWEIIPTGDWTTVVQ